MRKSKPWYAPDHVLLSGPPQGNARNAESQLMNFTQTASEQCVQSVVSAVNKGEIMGKENELDVMGVDALCEEGVPVRLVALIVALLVGLIVLALFHPWETRASINAPEMAAQKAQAETQKAQIELATQQQKNFFSLQMKISESCLAKGSMPQIEMSGIVICKK